tara:strand:+ start:4785 stop:6098 length:1314 start_codon:yes stop_codon:yes gene_type:complete
MTLNRLYIITIILFTLFSCKPKFEIKDTSLGSVDATSYVAIGGSSTAGYSDGALNLNGQENSYASIIAKQFNEVSPTVFNQPLVSTIGINLDGNSRLIMGYKTDCNGETSLSPVREAASGDNTILGSNIYTGSGPFNNMGVPELSTLEVTTSGFGVSNPYYSRITSDGINGSILGDALLQSPTFFSVRLGEQDILNSATKGTTVILPLTSGPDGVGFDGSLDAILSALSGTGANGVIADIPYILDYPFFTTIPYDGLEIDAAQATTLNQVFNPLGISFQVGKNPFTIEDPSSPFNVRKMVPGELVLLSVPLDSVKCMGMGSVNAIPDKYILTLEEIDSIKVRIDEYNAAIGQIASDYGVTVVGLGQLYDGFNSGTTYNGITLSTEFVSGGAFSLDGINLNPRGQSMVANKFIELMNSSFNANIPFADPIKYSGIIFP